MAEVQLMDVALPVISVFAGAFLFGAAAALGAYTMMRFLRGRSSAQPSCTVAVAANPQPAARIKNELASHAHGISCLPIISR